MTTDETRPRLVRPGWWEERLAIHRWRSAERSIADRGFAFGRGMAPVIAQTVASYRRLFRQDVGLLDEQIASRGREFGARIREYGPHLAQEVEAIAAGANLPAELVFAVNARTELLSGGRVAGAGGECSTVGIVDSHHGRAILGQNWDFHPALAASRTCWTVEGVDVTFAGLTEAGVLAKLGVNSHGLAIGINFLSSDADGGRDGIPVHVLLRDLLEQARSLLDAKDIISAASMSSSVCVSVAASAGLDVYDAASFERWPGGLSVHHSHDHPPHLAHTNHFLEAISAKDVIAAGPMGDASRSRYEQLRDALRLERTCEVDLVCRYLSSERIPPGGQAIHREIDETAPWVERSGTLATAIFEVPSGRFWHRDPFDGGGQLELCGEVGTAS